MALFDLKKAGYCYYVIMVMFMIEVAAALITKEEQGRKKFMICRRPENKARGLLWEFVGGKVEPGESREQALIRECREELDVTVIVGDKFCEVEHVYPDITINLTIFNCRIEKGTPRLIEHSDMRWITPEEIKNYEFCPADKAILSKISTEWNR